MDPLREVIERGSPAQAELARQLQDADGEAAKLLFDAYLNDPYLTRH